MLDVLLHIDETGRVKNRDAVQRMQEQFVYVYAGRDCRVRVTEPKRSSRQNRFYWGAVIATIHRAMVLTGTHQQVIAETGEIITTTPEDLHELFKKTYLPWRDREIFGKAYEMAPTTTTLSVAAFSEYLLCIETDERVRRLLAHAGLEWPDSEAWQETNGAFRSGNLSEAA